MPDSMPRRSPVEEDAEDAATGGRVGWLSLCVSAIAAVSLAAIAWEVRPSAALHPAGGIGSLQAITLINGQVYFGTLTAAGGGQIELGDVFEGVTNVNAQTNQRTTQLVRRKANAWHGPPSMTIPNDRVLFSEVIGPSSSVGKAMQEAAAGK